MKIPLILACLVWAAHARPLWPENPVGTASAASGGGGAARTSGVDALFVNPAALELPGGFQVETGMMGMTDGLAPYGVFGAQGRPGSAYALGYFYDARDASGPAHQGLLGGGSWNLLRGMPGDAVRSVAVGISAHTFGTETALGVDADAGVRARVWKRGVFGAAARNLLESGIGQKPEGYTTHRRYLLSAGLAAPMLRWWRLRVRDPEADYEFRAVGYRPSRMAHAFSAATSFIQDGVMGVRATVLLPHTGTVYFAGGFNLRLPLGRGLLTCGYAFTSGSGRAGDSPSNSVSLNFSSYTRGDKLAPLVAVKADRLRFFPGDGEGGWLDFQVSATDRTPAGEDKAMAEESGDAIGRLQEWSLTICAVAPDGRAGATARTFRGKDLPPRLIRWDGKDDEGAVAPPGFYAFRLSARDASGNQGVTGWQLLEITSGRKPEPRPVASPDSLDLDVAPVQ